MFILTLGAISSFKYANFETAARSVESTSATNLLQNGSQASYVQLNLVIVSFGNLALPAFDGSFELSDFMTFAEIFTW